MIKILEVIVLVAREIQALRGIGTGDNFLDNTPKAEETKAKMENLFKSNFQTDMNYRVNIWNM